MGLTSHVRLLDASRAGDGRTPIDLLAFEVVRVTRLRAGDLVLCTAGDVIPSDGFVVAGCATIDADRHEMASGDRVRSGRMVLSGHIVVRITLGADA